MVDYRSDIETRAGIVDVTLTYEQLSYLNQSVNDRVESGTHRSDALDYAYFYIKNNYTNE
jgi:hypothetical protein